MSTPTDVVPWVPEPTEAKPGRPHRPQAPEVDPFYRAPDGFGAQAPGTILRGREVAIGFLGLVALQCSAWQLLYRSTDLHGGPEAAVTTVLLPEGAAPFTPRPLLAYQCAIDAITATSFPSHVLQRGSRAAGTVPQLELLVIANALERGWAVSIADHEGAGGRFGAPREPGYRVLDGIRAATRFAPLGLSPAAPVAIWGYSGGAMASSWAAEMAPDYAPELQIAGAVLGAPVGDPGQTFIRLNGTRLAALPVTVIAALRHVYPGLDRVLRAHTDDAGLRRLDLIETLGQLSAMMRFAGEDFEDHLDVPLADLLALPEILEVFDDLRLGARTPACPLLIVHAVHDQIIHIQDVDDQVQRYLNAGAQVTYLRDRCSEHISLMPLSAPLVLDWLDDRIAGRPVPASSITTVYSTALSLSAIRGFLRMARVAANVITGRRLDVAIQHTPAG